MVLDRMNEADAGGLPDRCVAVTRAGVPCRNRAAAGEARCVFHLPRDHPYRRAVAAAGGRGKSSTARARRHGIEEALTLVDVRALVGVALKTTLAGRTAPGVGSAVANLARAYSTLTETIELEARVAELEKASRDRRGA